MAHRPMGGITPLVSDDTIGSPQIRLEALRSYGINYSSMELFYPFIKTYFYPFPFISLYLPVPCIYLPYLQQSSYYNLTHVFHN